MLPAITDTLPVSEAWAYEPKADGWRMLAYESLGQWILITRGGLNYTTDFPKVAEQLSAALRGSQAVLDGEIVAFDKRGRQHRELMLQHSAATIIYYVFDILELDGVPTLHEPWRNRRQLLEKVVNKQENVVLNDYYEHTDLEFLQRAARRKGLEGIVAKRKDSPYRQNGRSKNGWLKARFPLYSSQRRKLIKTVTE